jgi:hypothetical protein
MSKDLKKARQAVWIDPEFGPDPKLSDLETYEPLGDKEAELRNAQIEKAIYFADGNEIPRGFDQPDNLDFRFPEEFLDTKNVKFIIGDASANDVQQGAIGDCWFIGALSVLATNDVLLRGGAQFIDPDFEELVDENVV